MVKTSGIGGFKAARIVGVPYRTLDNWIRTGLLSVGVPASGLGTRRSFSFLDLVRAKLVADLRAQGISTPMIRRVQEELTNTWGTTDPLAQTTRLVVVGDKLLWGLDDRSLLDTLNGQLATVQLLIVPVGAIYREIQSKMSVMSGRARAA
jgi:DNA-binding transcriptional MerR regulator